MFIPTCSTIHVMKVRSEGNKIRSLSRITGDCETKQTVCKSVNEAEVSGHGVSDEQCDGRG